MCYTPAQGGTQDGLWQERKHLIPSGCSKKPCTHFGYAATRGYRSRSSSNRRALDVAASTPPLTINIRCIWLRSISILPLSERKPALCWSKRERCRRRSEEHTSELQSR